MNENMEVMTTMEENTTEDNSEVVENSKLGLSELALLGLAGVGGIAIIRGAVKLGKKVGKKIFGKTQVVADGDKLIVVQAETVPEEETTEEE